MFKKWKNVPFCGEATKFFNHFLGIDSMFFLSISYELVLKSFIQQIRPFVGVFKLIFE